MEDKLRLNTNFYGFEGIIGRRDFFLNCLYVSALSILVTLPIYNWIYTNAESFWDLLKIHEVFSKSPIWLKIWALVGLGGVSVPYISNVFRRLNDIYGEVRLSLQLLFSTFSILGVFGFTVPAGLLVNLVSVIMFLILLARKGEITSKYPHDFRKEFNWAAFLGTWIWGLFNKSYKTLWQILIWFTPWSLHYSLYCGLKGNEWAYKNKKYSDENELKRSQETQTIVFVVLTFLVFPVIYFTIIFVIVFALMASPLLGDGNVDKTTTKTDVAKIEKNLDRLTTTMASVYFEEYEINENENKFYLKSDDWKHYTINEKKEIFDFATTISAQERTKLHRESNPNTYHRYRKYDETLRTKIYCIETGKLLAEYKPETSIGESENFDLKREVISAVKAYKFY